MDDVQAITNLVFSYAELLDTGDLDGLRQLFAPATVRTHGTSEAVPGPAAIQQLIADAVHLYDGAPSTKHVITNLIVEVDDDRRSATARSYFTALQGRPELPLQPILAGRWHDRFARTGDHWEFAERVIYPDLIGDLRFHIKGVNHERRPERG
jgi:hypothetical protein